MPNDQAAAAVSTALETGYRAIDTAAYYGNETGVGEGLRTADVPRAEVHLTTKVWHTDLGYAATLRAFDRSLANLQVDYVDLYLIHWPVPSRDLYVETWQALEKIKSSGGARSIGVSNFPQAQIERLLTETGTAPAVNQIELHPWLPQKKLRAYDARQNIATQAWSPLGHGQLVTDPVVRAIAEAHSRDAGQVLLRWNLDLGNIVISKSVTPERIRSNIQVFDFALTTDDHARLAALNAGKRTGPNPETYGI